MFWNCLPNTAENLRILTPVLPQNTILSLPVSTHENEHINIFSVNKKIIPGVFRRIYLAA